MSKIRIRLMIKLFLSYLLIFILLLAVIVIIFVGYTKRMNEYFMLRTDEALEQLVDEFQKAYEEDPDQITSVGRGIKIITKNMGFEILFTDIRNEVIYSYSADDVSKQPPPIDEGVFPGPFEREFERVEKKYDIEVDGIKKGVLTISYFGEHNLNKNDRQLLNVLQRTYQTVLFTVILLGVTVSFFLSRSITKPMKTVILTANRIRQGELLARANVKSNTTEIQELSYAINYLADTLQKEDALRKQMTSDMAHEIRTPLTALRNFIEAFLDGVIDPDAIQLDKCYKEVLRMTDLVERLKDIAALEETQLILHNERFDLNTEIGNMVDLFTPQFVKKKIQVCLDLQMNIFVFMDKSKLDQMMMNLLSNANRYTDDGGTVDIRLLQDNKTTSITVSDSGIGIDQEDIPYIFERFYRSDKSRSRDTGGMGVGLTIVKQLVELYQGQIHVDSVLGNGSSFTIEFENKYINGTYS